MSATPTMKAPEGCGYQSGDAKCIRGMLWELTYSEMGPPDQRQGTGRPCPKCNGSKR